MLFNSLQFIIFFVIVYSLYLLLSHKWQNRLLLVASYVFYGAWDWRFLSLIWISTVLDYICGLTIAETSNKHKRKFFLWLSVIGNLTILGYFKYFNFFITNMQSFLNTVGFTSQPVFLKIILPLGISFYTFQTMSYTIDVYRREIKPTKNFFDFALFVAFFPQLVAGPIERAKRLLPQIISKRQITKGYILEGVYLIYWGLYLKIFIADNMAKIVDPVFAAQLSYNGIKVLLAAYAFYFQIFCDFAGYSYMARGLGKLMGFDIMVNFCLPFFATNPQDMWNRWHISLNSWIRDYLFTPLFLSLKSLNKNLRIFVSTIFSMTIMGLWHGAQWTFIVWGFCDGLMLSFYVLMRPRFKNWIQPKSLLGRNVWLCVRIIFMFNLCLLGLILFRAQDIPQVIAMLKAVIFNFNYLPGMGIELMFINFFIFSIVLVFVEIIQYIKNDLLTVLKWNPYAQVALYLIMLFSMVLLGSKSTQAFIYFNF